MIERPAHAKPHLQIILIQNKALEHMLYEPLSTYHLEHEKIILELRNSVIVYVRIIVLKYLKLFRVTELSQNCIYLILA